MDGCEYALWSLSLRSYLRSRLRQSCRHQRCMDKSMTKIRVAVPSLFALLAVSSFLGPQLLSDSKTDQDVLLQASHALNQIAKKATPAVVSITAIKSPSKMAEDELPQSADPASDQLGLGVGSGVIVKSNGIILTNHHVIQGAQKITVTLDENDNEKIMNGRKEKTKLTATVIGDDPKTDLAVIQLTEKPKRPLPTLDFGDSEQISTGDWIVAVGNPFGLNHSMTSGIISAVGRGELGMLDIEDFIQTDAAINPGNSGGPLLNSKGQMIGINTAIFSESGGFMGIGFSIPSKLAQQVYAEILDHGRVIRGWVGVTAQDLNPGLSKYFKAPSEQGALLSAIEPKGPAALASLRAGDIVTQFGKDRIDSARQFKALVAKAKIDIPIPVGIIREGNPHLFTLIIEEAPSPKTFHPKQLAGQRGDQKKSKPGSHLGITVQDMPPEFANVFHIPTATGALIADVQVGSPAFDAGLSRGDIILNANKTPIKNAADFVRTVQKFGKSELAVLYIQRGPHEKLFIPIQQPS